ncbi:MAG: hypothetical protein JNK48_29955 [Bryobacterales bacterium]|nr:hypothetical protein [Bryobacterales bacterium]
MRTYCVFFAIFCFPAASQQVTSYSTDLNGRRMPDAAYSASSSGNVSTRTELTQSVNGRLVPLESVEERVLRDDANGRVIERITRKFDPNGRPGMAEKQQIQERKNADGSVSSTVDTFRSDLNGRFELMERVTTQASKSGNTTNANVQVERPTLNGTLDVVERKTRVASEDKTSAKSDTTTFRKDPSGRFVEAHRIVTDAQEQNGQRVENSAQYEASQMGRLELTQQSVARVRKNSDGSESREVDVYRNVPGRVVQSATPPLLERQIVEQRKSGDQLVETTVVQRPSINDPNRLGAPMKIGERVCTGKDCK